MIKFQRNMKETSNQLRIVQLQNKNKYSRFRIVPLKQNKYSRFRIVDDAKGAKMVNQWNICQDFLNIDQVNK